MLKSLVSSASLLLFAAASAYGDYAWTKRDYPGAVETSLNDVSGNRIVGTYKLTYSGPSFGFVYDGSAFKPLACQGAQYTSPTGVDGQNIVGEYKDAGGVIHGFLYDGSAWETLDYPGASYTRAMGISGNVIVGSSSLGMFTYDGSNYTPIVAPPDPQYHYDYVGDIDGNNIVGGTTDWGDNGFGYIFDGSNWTSLHFPWNPVPGPGVTMSFNGISGGNIVGTYYAHMSFRDRGILYQSGTWLDVTYPGSWDCTPHGIDGDTVVGSFSYQGASGTHGFVMTIPEPATLVLLVAGALVLRSRRTSRYAGN